MCATASMRADNEIGVITNKLQLLLPIKWHIFEFAKVQTIFGLTKKSSPLGLICHTTASGIGICKASIFLFHNPLVNGHGVAVASDAYLHHTAAVCWVWQGVALAVYLVESLPGCAVHLEFEDISRIRHHFQDNR